MKADGSERSAIQKALNWREIIDANPGLKQGESAALGASFKIRGGASMGVFPGQEDSGWEPQRSVFVTGMAMWDEEKGFRVIRPGGSSEGDGHRGLEVGLDEPGCICS